MTLAARASGGLTRIAPQSAVDFAYRHRFHPAVRWLRDVAVKRRGAEEGAVIARGPLTGWRFAHVDSYAMWLGTHEPEVQESLRDFLEPGMVAYDIGAHVGYMVLLMASCVGPTGQVVAYEVDPRNVYLLERNIEINGLADFVEARSLGLGQEAGRAELELHDSSAMSELMLGSGGSVEITTLDAEVSAGRPAPHLLLIDTEGMEEPILRGGRRTLSVHRPAVLAEHHHKRAELAELLAPLGYSGRDIDNDHTLFTV